MVLFISFLKNIKSVRLFYFRTQRFEADKAIRNFQYLTTHNNYRNQVYLRTLRIKSK